MLAPAGQTWGSSVSRAATGIQLLVWLPRLATATTCRTSPPAAAHHQARVRGRAILMPFVPRFRFAGMLKEEAAGRRLESLRHRLPTRPDT